jgi:hypothetical protein
MKRLFGLIAIALIAGCGPAPKAKVIGASGFVYTAPSMCEALVQCQRSAQETSCYYDQSIFTEQNGAIVESGCKEVKK